MAGGHLCMLLGQLEVIQEDRHAFTAVGKHWLEVSSVYSWVNWRSFRKTFMLALLLVSTEH
jgi:hypothetical protein